MATKDVMEQLRLVSGPLEGALQLPLRNAILRLLDDKNSDVSTMAVKCLSQLCQKFAQEHIAFVVDKLADMIVDPSKEASRDIVTDGLQTLIASVDDAAGTIMAPKLVQSLLRGLTHTEKRDEVDCEMACLTIVKNVSTTRAGQRNGGSERARRELWGAAWRQGVHLTVARNGMGYLRPFMCVCDVSCCTASATK